MASTYLTFTQQTPTTVEAQKFTLSMWVKKCANGAIQGLYGNTYSNTHRGYLYFDSSDRLNFFDSSGTSLVLSRVFRDTNAWYHIVLAVDTTQSSDANKVKFYINGELYAGSYSTAQYPNNNQDLKIMNTSNTPYMGRILEAGTSYYLNGCLSHVHFTQGYVYQASDFGETDSTTGEWKIKTSPSIANYGTNGFWWLKDSVATTDHSPNSNSFTVSGGTLTKTEDNPSNVFCTINALDAVYVSCPITNGNNTVNMNNTNERYVMGTLGMNSGKYYWEAKIDARSGDTYSKFGIESIMKNGVNGYEPDSYGYRGEGGGKKVNNGNFTNWGNSYTTGDILGCAVDLDNNKIYFSKNGTWQESGDPTSGSTGTGAAFTLGTPSSGFYFPSVGKEDADTIQWSFNFGNGYFGTTAVSSAGTNASGIGIFEYDVPTGYTALSTKGLNL